MKNIKIFLWLVVCMIPLPLLAASNGTPNAIHVDFLRNYNPGKLSVLSWYNYIYMDDIDIYCDSNFVGDSFLEPLDYIISINEIPIEEINKNDIYPMINGRDGRVKIVGHSILQNGEYTLFYTPKNLNMRGFDETLANLRGVPSLTSKEGIEIRTDNSIPDWSKYRSISIVLSSSDPLLEKELAQKALWHLRAAGYPLIIDDKNPDLILKVSFNEEESVVSTYVPPTTTYIDRGSNTYVTKGKSSIYVNSFRLPPRKVTQGGYTQENISNNHFLEVTLLDAKKMLDVNQTVPPIVWQLRYSKHLDYQKSLSEASDEVLQYCRVFPGKTFGMKPCFRWSGVCWDEERSIVTDVYKGSPAERLGLQAGDEILKINGESNVTICEVTFWKGGSDVTIEHDDWKFKTKLKKESLGKILVQGGAKSKNGNVMKFPVFGESTVWYRNTGEAARHSDFMKRTLPSFIHEAKDTDVYEIKRNGKKMKLVGKLYDKCYFYPLFYWK